jgi:hypothetical protein
MRHTRKMIHTACTLLAVMTVYVVGALSHEAHSMVVAPCRAVDTYVEPKTLNYLRTLMSSNSTNYKTVRDSLGFAKVSATRVKLVTKAATCQSGVNALNGVLETPTAQRSIWLFDLVNGYAILDPSIVPTGTQPTPLYIFSNQFVYNSAVIVH